MSNLDSGKDFAQFLSKVIDLAGADHVKGYKLRTGRNIMAILSGGKYRRYHTDVCKRVYSAHRLTLNLNSLRDCPDCLEESNRSSTLEYKGRQETQFSGLLTYYKCTLCKEEYVSQNGGLPEIAAAI